MSKLFNFDSPFVSCLSKLADMIILNITFIICCIPIVTIGASITALYDAIARLFRDEGNIYRAYFKSLYANFKQATAQWMIMLFTGVPLAICLRFYLNSNMAIGHVLLWIAVLFAFIWCAVIAWVFPLQSKFFNSVKNSFRNAILCSIAYLPRTIVMVVLNLFPVALVLLTPTFFFSVSIFIFLIWFSLVVSINLKIIEKVIQAMIERIDTVDVTTTKSNSIE